MHLSAIKRQSRLDPTSIVGPARDNVGLREKRDVGREQLISTRPLVLAVALVGAGAKAAQLCRMSQSKSTLR